jgi:CHAD domain-containing protein
MSHAGMGHFVLEQTSARLGKLEAELKNAAGMPDDADAIHDLRVAIRRLNQVLRVFQPWLSADGRKKLHGRLKRLMRRCAAARNFDIAVEVLTAAGCEDARVIESLRKERDRVEMKLRRTLKKSRRRNPARRYQEHLKIAAREGPSSVADAARSILPGMVDELFGAGRDATKAGASYHRMHRFRLLTKRVRYTLEVFAPVYGARAAPVLEPLKGLQEKLGSINDCAATLEVLGQHRAASRAVKRLAREREAEFRAYWKKRFGPQAKSQWKKILDGPQEAPRRDH